MLVLELVLELELELEPELEYLVGLLGVQVLRDEILELRLDLGPGKLELVEGHTGLLQVPAGQGVSGDECNPRYLCLIHVIKLDGVGPVDNRPSTD